ncbi:helix-turn-helix domain-containing protein [Mycobacterium sp. HM-7]
MPTPTPDELITASQAGRILDRSYRTVLRLMEQGELSCAMKVPGPNGAYLFRRADVEKLAADRAKAASA